MAKSQHRFLTQHTENGVLILTFTESLLQADAVAEALTIIYASQIQKVILDCQSIRSLVSASLLADHAPFTPLLRLSRQLTEEGGRLVLCNFTPSIDEVFRITRLAQFFEIQPDVDSAVACLTS